MISIATRKYATMCMLVWFFIAQKLDGSVLTVMHAWKALEQEEHRFRRVPKATRILASSKKIDIECTNNTRLKYPSFVMQHTNLVDRWETALINFT